MAGVLAPTSRAGIRLPYIASRIYLFLILFQIPLFRVSCRSGMCTTPLEVTSCQLMSSKQVPLGVIRAFLYPGALVRSIISAKTFPSWEGLIQQYNLTDAQSSSPAIDINRLEVLAGSYFAVAGAFVGLLKPGRMSMFGTLLIVWGLVKESVLGKPATTDPSKAAFVYPTMLIALLCAVFSIKYDMNKVNRIAKPVARPLKSSSKAKLT